MTFEEWLDEIEIFASRLERLYGDFPEVEDKEKLFKWLEAAYTVGYSASTSKPKTTLADINFDIFDIESLDPDDRSWYYDGGGTKRKKE